jgi:hypothetical protein
MAVSPVGGDGLRRGVQRGTVMKMTTYAQHPEFKVSPELRDTVERVRSGIEPVIVLTDSTGQPLAAIVSLAALELLDAREVAVRNEAALEESDCAGMRVR